MIQLVRFEKYSEICLMYNTHTSVVKYFGILRDNDIAVLDNEKTIIIP